MHDNSIRSVMRRRGIIEAEPDATVRKVTKQMARRNAGAVLVIDGDRLVGIFTERDAVFRVMAPGLDAAETRLRDVMTLQSPDDRPGPAVRLRARVDAQERVSPPAGPRKEADPGHDRRRVR